MDISDQLIVRLADLLALIAKQRSQAAEIVGGFRRRRHRNLHEAQSGQLTASVGLQLRVSAQSGGPLFEAILSEYQQNSTRDDKLPLQVWLSGLWLMLQFDKGSSSIPLAEALGFSQPSA